MNNFNINIINPIRYKNWNDILQTNENHCFFHTTEWAKVLVDTYNHIPSYFTSIENNHLKTLIPFMEIKNVFIPRKGVSLPFTDFCEPIISNTVNYNELVNHIIEYAIDKKWNFFELRGGVLDGIKPSLVYYDHTIDLSNEEDIIFNNLRHSTKTNINKAFNSGIEIIIDNSANSMEHFYYLQSLTRRKHGIPPQPKKFFNNIFKYIISNNKGNIFIAVYKGNIINSSIFFHFGEKVIYKYAAWDMKYSQLRSNNLLTWEAIKWYKKNNFNIFSFGRTDPENKGLLQYKLGWGVRERTINYYRFDCQTKQFCSSIKKSNTNILNFLLSKMPLYVLQSIGNNIYKYYI